MNKFGVKRFWYWCENRIWISILIEYISSYTSASARSYESKSDKRET